MLHTRVILLNGRPVTCMVAIRVEVAGTGCSVMAGTVYTRAISTCKNPWLGGKRCSFSRRKGVAQNATAATFADPCAGEFLIHGFFLFLCCVLFAVTDVTAATSDCSSLHESKWSRRVV
jgi:hypothetical protein